MNKRRVPYVRQHLTESIIPVIEHKIYLAETLVKPPGDWPDSFIEKGTFSQSNFH